MRLTCISRWSGMGPDGVEHDFRVGQDINVTDYQAEYLQRISPSCFENPAVIAAEKVTKAEEAKARAAKVKAEAPDEPDTSAMSTKTATGLTVPDRRARGGRVRGRGKGK